MAQVALRAEIFCLSGKKSGDLFQPDFELKSETRTTYTHSGSKLNRKFCDTNLPKDGDRALESAY